LVRNPGTKVKPGSKNNGFSLVGFWVKLRKATLKTFLKVPLKDPWLVALNSPKPHNFPKRMASIKVPGFPWNNLPKGNQPIQEKKFYP